MKDIINPEVTKGDIAVDDRGVLRFINNFDSKHFKNIKRFYQVENINTHVIRAFHGHKKEAKYVYVPSGTIILCAVKIDNFKKPSQDLEINRFIISAKKPSIVYVPAGYANGFKPLEDNTIVIFYSTTTLQQSMGDDYRFPYDYWGTKIWETENR